MYYNSNISLIDFSKDNCGNIGIRIENRKIIVWSKKENNKTINEFKSSTYFESSFLSEMHYRLIVLRINFIFLIYIRKNR